MSASDEVEEISNVVGGADRHGCQEGGSDGDDDEDDDDAATGIGKKQRRRTGCGFGKAKRVVLHQFTKANNQLRRSKRALLRRSSSSGNASTGSGKKMIRGDATATGCKFCFSRPKVLESPNGSPTSDPGDPKFSHAMLKTLIEKNDFYSKECNPHAD